LSRAGKTLPESTLLASIERMDLEAVERSHEIRLAATDRYLEQQERLREPP